MAGKLYSSSPRQCKTLTVKHRSHTQPTFTEHKSASRRDENQAFNNSPRVPGDQNSVNARMQECKNARTENQ